MKHRILSCFSLKIALIFSFFIVAESPSIGQIVTDRPDQTESSSTVGAGNLQLESGILIGFEEGAVQSTRQLLAPTTLFRYGITEAIELRLLSQFETSKIGEKSFSGISDLEIGTKIQILKASEERNIEIAFLSHLVLPTGTKELTVDDYGNINKLSIAHDLSDRMSLGYNVGYNYFGTGNGDLTYSLALGISVTDKVGVYIEPYGDVVEFEELVQSFDAGVTYLLNENLQFDFSFGTGINHNMNYTSLGVSWLVHQK